MKLNLSKTDEANKAETYFAKLLKDGAKIELKKISPPRSINQNSYLHVLFTLWGSHFGYTLYEAKQVVKIELNSFYLMNDIPILFSTSKMSSKDLSEFVNKFRNWAADNGCYLPTAEEYKLRYFDYSQETERAEAIEKRYSY